MKKILTMVIGLLTVIAMFAVVAAARNGDADPDARTATAVASGEEAPGDRDGPDQDGEDRNRLDQDGADWEDGEDPDDLDADEARKTAAAWNTDRDYEEVTSRKFQMLAAMGVINQDQIPAITAWVTEAASNADQNFDNPAQTLAAMVDDEVITQKQADSITELFSLYEEMKSDKDGYRHTQPSDTDDTDRNEEEGTDQGGEDRNRLDQDGADWEDGEDPDDLDADEARKTAAAWNTDRDYEEVTSRKFQMLAAMGVINQDQIPAITAWVTEAASNADQNFDNPAQTLAAMVDDEVITQKQADSITELFSLYEEMKSDKDGYRHTQPSDTDDTDRNEEEGTDQGGEADHRQTESSNTDGDDADGEGDEL